MKKGLLVTGRLLMTVIGCLIISNWGWFIATQAATTQSQVQVEMTPSDDDNAVSPVDPDDPSKPYPGDPVDEDNVAGTGSRGKLTIDFVSNLKFNAITTAGGPFKTTAKNERAMIQITDRHGCWMDVTGHAKRVAKWSADLNDVFKIRRSPITARCWQC